MNNLILQTNVILTDHYIAKRWKWKYLTHRTYIGMNWWAANELGVRFPFTKDTVVITDPRSKFGATWTIDSVLRHERAESAQARK